VEDRDEKALAGNRLAYGAPFGPGSDRSHDREGVVAGKSAKSEDEPMLYCPVCSTRLAERKCKLFCERCGYYMSCADYY
jgi:hypothetical protein